MLPTRSRPAVRATLLFAAVVVLGSGVIALTTLGSDAADEVDQSGYAPSITLVGVAPGSPVATGDASVEVQPAAPNATQAVTRYLDAEIAGDYATSFSQLSSDDRRAFATRVLIARGSLDQAAALLDTAIELGPETTAAIVRGEVALLLNDRAGAEAAFAIARTRDDHLRARGEATDLDSATFLANRGQTAEAVTRASAAYAVRTTVLGADVLAWALFMAGDLDEALPLVDDALATNIKSPTVRVHSAAILAAAGETGRARDELTVAFRATPWTDLSIRPVAIQLADQLGMRLPASWSL